MDVLERQLSRADAEPSDELDHRIEALVERASVERHAAGKRGAMIGRLYPVLPAASLAMAAGLAVGYMFGRGAGQREFATPIARPVQSPVAQPTPDSFAVQHVVAHVEPDFFDFTIDPAGPLGRISVPTDPKSNSNGDTH